jgi:hypothetical protein
MDMAFCATVTKANTEKPRKVILYTFKKSNIYFECGLLEKAIKPLVWLFFGKGRKTISVAFWKPIHFCGLFQKVKSSSLL